MLRTLVALLLGALVMVGAVAALQALGHWVWPESIVTPGDRDSMAAEVAQMPLVAKIWVLIVYATAVELGVITAVLVNRARWRGLAMSLGLLMTALCALNFWLIPHPWWMVGLGLLLPLPIAMTAGYWLRVPPQGSV